MNDEGQEEEVIGAKFPAAHGPSVPPLVKFVPGINRAGEQVINMGKAGIGRSEMDVQAKRFAGTRSRGVKGWPAGSAGS